MGTLSREQEKYLNSLCVRRYNAKTNTIDSPSGESLHWDSSPLKDGEVVEESEVDKTYEIHSPNQGKWISVTLSIYEFHPNMIDGVVSKRISARPKEAQIMCTINCNCLNESVCHNEDKLTPTPLNSCKEEENESVEYQFSIKGENEWSYCSKKFCEEMASNDNVEIRIIGKVKNTEEYAIDCRSEEGITIGLIDSILTNMHLLKQRDLSPSGVEEALKDFSSHEFLSKLTPTVKECPTCNKVDNPICSNFHHVKAYGVKEETPKVECGDKEEYEYVFQQLINHLEKGQQFQSERDKEFFHAGINAMAKVCNQVNAIKSTIPLEEKTLRSLEEITDEDKAEVGKLIHTVIKTRGTTDLQLGHSFLFNDKNSGDMLQVVSKVYQFLQSKGYQLPKYY